VMPGLPQVYCYSLRTAVAALSLFSQAF
jgi:hypothetical protein